MHDYLVSVALTDPLADSRRYGKFVSAKRRKIAAMDEAGLRQRARLMYGAIFAIEALITIVLALVAFNPVVIPGTASIALLTISRDMHLTREPARSDRFPIV